MRRRLTQAILFVTVLMLAMLGVPLAVVVSRYYENSAAVDLQRRAAEATAEIALPLEPGAVQELIDEGVSEVFGVYDGSGNRVAGVGPSQADGAVRSALTGEPSLDHHTEVLVYAAPVNEHGSESVAGAVRVSEPDAVIDGRIHRAWLIMAVAAVTALVVAWGVAAAQARRLARPVADLASAARRMGHGGLVLPPARTGVEELDVLGETLSSSSVHLAQLIARERAFTGDVSHQLRTPLTGLGLLIDAGVDDAQVRRDLHAEVSRLQDTVEHLLALSRDQLAAGSTHSVGEVVTDVERRWAPRLAAAGRALVVDTHDGLERVHGSKTALSQVLDVLVDNALRHGVGTVTIVARSAPGGVALEVSDEGAGVLPRESARIFERHHGVDHGIGLALARSLVEADGGRLLLTRFSPPTFTVLFSTAAEPRTPADIGAKG
jgi:signal transduction histidine kinase